MRIKRFFADNSEKALTQVTNTLGEDAVIISHKALNEGVEVLATLPEKRQAVTFANPAVTSMLDLSQEIDRMRGLMEQGNRSELVEHKFDEIQTMVTSQLTQLGISQDVAKNLTTRPDDVDRVTPQTVTRAALAELARQLPVSSDEILMQQGIIALLGPAGAGKTTTLIKLAQRYVRTVGDQSIAIINLDQRRSGANARLGATLLPLGIPVLNASDESEFEQCLQAVADKALVLIDTAGLTQAQLRKPQTLMTLAEHHLIHNYLVLPSNLQPAVLERIAGSLSCEDIRGCIVTKVDETTALGTVLSVAIQQQLAICYWSDGQQTDSHLYPAEQKHLVEKALSLASDALFMYPGRSADQPYPAQT